MLKGDGREFFFFFFNVEKGWEGGLFFYKFIGGGLGLV
jgi:hypothetical protein